MNHLSMLLAGVVIAAVSLGAAQDPPPELKVLAAKAGLDASVAAWCRAEFVPGRKGGYAVALSAGAEGGRYVAIQPDGSSEVLGSFERGADLTCYTRGEARKLDATIRRSETIQGAVRPRWNTSVVCGFVDNTSAVCWQYSAALRRFVQVGQWTT